MGAKKNKPGQYGRNAFRAIFNDGFIAAKIGLASYDNPYPSFSRLYKIWESGWVEYKNVAKKGKTK